MDDVMWALTVPPRLKLPSHLNEIDWFGTCNTRSPLMANVSKIPCSREQHQHLLSIEPMIS